MCDLETTNNFICYSYIGKSDLPTVSNACGRGETLEKIEIGSFSCCLPDERRIRAEILTERSKAEGVEGWNLARITKRNAKRNLS